MNLAEQLIERVNAERKRVVVIGDAMTDHWVHGRVESCMDGCPKFVTENVHVAQGGAANAYNCLHHWKINRDLFTYPDSAWPMKYRFVTTDTGMVFRWDDETATVGAVDRSRFIWSYNTERALDTVKHADAVLLSDYDKGFLTLDLIAQVAIMCAKRGVPCVADCNRAPEVYAGAILKCNEEYQHRHNLSLSNMVYDSDDSGVSLVVTSGALNPAVWDNGLLEKGWPFVPAVECVNHVGAGDCFAAHLVLALAYGFSLKESAAIAHSAGRVYVQRPHNCPPRPGEIAADMSGRAVPVTA